MNRPARSPLALRACPQATVPPLSVVPAHPSSVRVALCAAPVNSYDMGYAQ